MTSKDGTTGSSKRESKGLRPTVPIESSLTLTQFASIETEEKPASAPTGLLSKLWKKREVKGVHNTLPGSNNSIEGNSSESQIIHEHTEWRITEGGQGSSSSTPNSSTPVSPRRAGPDFPTIPINNVSRTKSDLSLNGLVQSRRGSTPVTLGWNQRINSGADTPESESGFGAAWNGGSGAGGARTTHGRQFGETRTLSSVLKRVSGLLYDKSSSNNLRPYNDSDFKKYWMPDSNCNECYDCGNRFTTFRRRHHCRICGQIFCSSCCNQEVPGKFFGYEGSLRVCTYCCEVALQYVRNQALGAAPGENPTASRTAIRQELQRKHMMESVGLHSSSPPKSDSLLLKNPRAPRESQTIAQSNSEQHGISVNLHSSGSSLEISPSRRNLDITAAAGGLPYKPGNFFKSSSHHDLSSTQSTEKDGGERSPSKHSSLLDPFGGSHATRGLSTSHSLTVPKLTEERRLLTQDSYQLRQIWERMTGSCAQGENIMFQNYRPRLRTYTSCCLGSDVIRWLLDKDIVAAREQALAIGQALVDAGYLEPATLASEDDAVRGFVSGVFAEDELFKRGFLGKDFVEGSSSTTQRKITERRPSLLQHRHVSAVVGYFKEKTTPESPEREDEEEPAWFKEISRDRGQHDPEPPSPTPSTSVATILITTPTQVVCSDGSTVAQTTSSRSSSRKRPVEKESRGDSHSYSDSRPGSKLRSPQPPHTSPGGSHPAWAANYPPDLSLTSISPSFLRGIMRAAGGALGIGKSAPSAIHNRRRADKRLKSAYEIHLKTLIRQLLVREELSLSWTETVYDLADKVSTVVDPDLRNKDDFMDLRQYIVIKKIPGARKIDSFIVDGVVCSKNVVHRDMRNQIKRAQILIFTSSIEYHRVQRSQRGIHSMEPVLLQEKEYLRNSVAKLTANKDPDRGLVLLAQNTVSRLAQEFLLQADVSLVMNVKQSVMERVQRSTRAKPVKSIEELVTPPILGYCTNFVVKRFSLPAGKGKTLMFFDGCDGALGVSVCLRGGSYDELTKIKRILNFAIFVAKNASHEMSYYLEELALPPAPEIQINTRDARMKRKSAPFWGQKTVKMDGEDTVSESDDEKDDIFGDAPVFVRESIESAKDAVKVKHFSTDSNEFDETEKRLKCYLSRYVVSSSPYLPLRRPYLLTEEGKSCVLRPSFPLQIYRSPLLSKNPHEVFSLLRDPMNEKHRFVDSSPIDVSFVFNFPESKSDAVIIKPKHPFLGVKFPTWFDLNFSQEEDAEENKKSEKDRSYFKAFEYGYGDPKQLNASLAEFRARGGRIQPRQFEQKALGVFSVDPPIRKGFRPLDEARGSLIKKNLSFKAGFSQLHDDEDLVFTEMHRKKDAEDEGNDSVIGLGISRHRAQALLGASTAESLDCLDPFNHQHLQVLFSSFSHKSNNAPYPCINPWVIDWNFYAEGDVPLGAFLERYCFRHNYNCPSPSCNAPMLDHIRRFLHNTACINVVETTLPEDVPLPTTVHAAYLDLMTSEEIESSWDDDDAFRVSDPDTIYNWSWCKKCSMITPMVPLTKTTWNLSFAKYLDLRFNAINVKNGAAHEDEGDGLVEVKSCRREKVSDVDGELELSVESTSSTKVGAAFEIPGQTLLVCPEPRPASTHPLIISSPDDSTSSRNASPKSSRRTSTTPSQLAVDIEDINHFEIKSEKVTSSSCQHSFHQDYFQYFIKNNVVVAFKHHEISLFEIAFPPVEVRIASASLILDPHDVIAEAGRVSSIVFELHKDILSRLTTLREESATEKLAQLAADYMEREDHMRLVMATRTEEIQNELVGIVSAKQYAEADVQAKLLAISDSLISLQQKIADLIHEWNTDLQEFVSQQKKSERQKVEPKAQGTSTSGKPITVPAARSSADTTSTKSGGNSKPAELLREASTSSSKSHKNFVRTDSLFDKMSLGHASLFPNASLGIWDSLDDIFSSAEVDFNRNEDNRQGTQNGSSRSASPALLVQSSTVSRTTPTESMFQSVASRSANITSEERADNFGRSPQRQGVSNEATEDSDLTPKQESIESSGEVFLKETDNQKPKVYQIAHSIQVAMEGDDDTKLIDGRKKEKQTRTMRELLEKIMEGKHPTVLNIPFEQYEHFLLTPKNQTSPVPVVVRDNQPSTIIAFALASDYYNQQLVEIQRGSSSEASDSSTPHAAHPHRSDSSSSLGIESLSTVNQNRSPNRRNDGDDAALDTNTLDPFDRLAVPTRSPMQSSPVPPTPSPLESSLVSGMSPTRSPHIECEFVDQLSNSRFFCKIYFAEQFRQLRTIILPQGESQYIRSLSHCVYWMARGGKSGSSFCKTKDDRFILKEMSQPEITSFHQHGFAERYISYIRSSIGKRRPTALAKILGVYRIGFRNAQTSAKDKRNLLVMENLFYGRKTVQIFDLKGSTRNRLVDTEGGTVDDMTEAEMVLLDENLLKESIENPMYLRPHSKTILTNSIREDTAFLSSNLVMDYSLLVGVDESNKELVIGIIDYIRTFTWDKKLETLVKSTVLGAGQGPPTVVSPELYRTRFLEAMDRYFLLVPDRWSGFGVLDRM